MSEMIYGIHAVQALLERAPERFQEVYILKGREDKRLLPLIHALEAQGVVIQVANRQFLDEKSEGAVHQGIIARVKPGRQYQENDLPDLLAQHDQPFLLILDGVTDPHNLGACLRSADAAGVHAVTQPEILLCDEATSALDPENTLSVLTLLKEINQRLGLTIVLITHEMEVIRTLCDRVSVLEGGRIVEQGDVWRVFGNPQHPVTRAMLGLQHPDRPEAGPPLRDGEQIVTLRFDGSSGREPNLQHIASLLGGDARLLYSNCERIQGRVIGQLQVRLSGPLAASALAQDGWVADSILTHHHQTAETTAS